jgi:hypothetical protein
MKYCKLIGDLVVQTQRSLGEGFIECLESTSCGMIKVGSLYELPPPPTAQEIDDAKTAQAGGLIKAFALVVLSEINILRVGAGLSERTVQQLINAVKDKLNV